MIKPETLEFPPMNCSLSSELGEYYQDFHGAIEMVESGYHGALDHAGIPLVDHGKQGSFADAIHTSQYALANLAAVTRGEQLRAERARVQLDWLVAAQERSGEFEGCWLMDHDNPKYRWLTAPWISALASGNAISALLRGWELFGDERYRNAADAAYRALHRPRPTMSLCEERDEQLWYEEYPADPPLHVLNGHIYALLGVADYARVNDDAEAHDRWRRAAYTALRHLEQFDLGFWSAYDLRWREPVSVHYQKNIHVPLLRILGALTDEAGFDTVADRWDSYTRSVVCRARWQAELRLHRWRTQPLTGRWRARSVNGSASSDGSIVVDQVAERASDITPSVSLRAFPYPFRAALSICNDADCLTYERFRRLHRFLSTDDETEWGPGLRMHVGGSFFMFRSPQSPNEFTVFDRLSNRITEDGEFILECARHGLLDVLHTYGCFTDETHFTRRHAELALEVLSSRGIELETWVNHGPPSNVQCIGRRPYWNGDAVGTPAYHADLTLDYGVRWIWTGEEMTDSFALSCTRGPQPGDGPLVEPYRLRDGRRARRFYRYTGLSGRTPVLEDLPDQLSGANLDALVTRGGYAVVYQHLAVRRVHPGFGTRAYRGIDEPWFTEAEVTALRNLSRRHHAGEIWVAPVTHLLRHHDVHRNLRWQARSEGDTELIVISSSDGSRVMARDLADMTFYCDQPDAVRVCLQTPDGVEPVSAVRVNPADETGRQSITLLPRGGPSALP